jgi:hypothetical protein
METSLLNIIVISKHLKEIKFTDLAPQALREYADAIEEGTKSFCLTDKTSTVVGQHAVERFKATNGCEVRVIMGVC